MAFSLTIAPATVISDGTSYADYIYDLHLHLNSQDIHLQRSYLDFCDLETHLLKFILFNQISPCPLAAASLIRKSKQNKMSSNDPFSSILRATSGNDSQDAASQSYEAYYSEDRSSYLISNYSPLSSPPPSSTASQSTSSIPPTPASASTSLPLTSEDIPNKHTDLLLWLQQLFTFQNIIQIFPFLKFFSNFELNYRQNSSVSDTEVTEFDFILPKKGEKNKQILTKFSLPFEVQFGQIIIWRFRSLKNDISFSIDLFGEPLLVSKRYASSREDITGVMQIPAIINGKQWGTMNGTCICEVKFENKYAGVSERIY
jgi:hypothetical protein